MFGWLKNKVNKNAGRDAVEMALSLPLGEKAVFISVLNQGVELINSQIPSGLFAKSCPATRALALDFSLAANSARGDNALAHWAALQLLAVALNGDNDAAREARQDIMFALEAADLR